MWDLALTEDGGRDMCMQGRAVEGSVFFKGKALYSVPPEGKEDMKWKIKCSCLLIKGNRQHCACPKALSAAGKVEFAPKQMRCG